jgi:transcriptional regulator with XRE-family HTH domain
MPRNNIDTYKIDQYVGKKISDLRLSKSIPKQTLAANINVTQQQITKYEKAINRVSASKLVLIANALSVDVSYFFKDLEKFTYKIKKKRTKTQSQ